MKVTDIANAAAAPATRNGGRTCAVAETHETYLRALGERVRNIRARRGMTRKMLSRHSGVSERYLAQLESGRGNISIGLLRQVAQAMNMPLAELADDRPERPVEMTLLLGYLGRLSPAELSRAHALLADRFDRRDGRRERIALIGLRGAGKTTLGARLAERLGVPFVRLVQEIEAESAMSVSEIFSLSGQAAYRRHERRALERVLDEHRAAVIEVGGSLVSEPETYELLLNGCRTVWLRATPEEHMSRVIGQGDTRPMAGNSEAMDDLRRILGNREALYAKADATLDTSGRTVEDCLDELVRISAASDSPTPDVRDNS